MNCGWPCSRSGGTRILFLDSAYPASAGPGRRKRCRGAPVQDVGESRHAHIPVHDDFASPRQPGEGYSGITTVLLLITRCCAESFSCTWVFHAPLFKNGAQDLG
ncbi:hypothetical protein PISMIDRAFT_207725 [Pisolithus microcarpus 441]|uniref:Uncharacterized protein n=1 Tax=Pisolithus microcarpus 441 TaxID=765257 RepID=A0A0C9ZDL5_9AGAM|nr:hypothetical protein PISMIDRAFT_207725 [Pisolithus microcarpus 441]